MTGGRLAFGELRLMGWSYGMSWRVLAGRSGNIACLTCIQHPDVVPLKRLIDIE